LEMRDPPQKGLLPLEDTSPTCQGYSLTSVSCPPTILEPLLTCPQLHLDVDPVVVVIGDMVVVGDAVEGVGAIVVVGAAVVGDGVIVVDDVEGDGAIVVPVSPEPDKMHLNPPPVPHPFLEHEVKPILIERPLLSDMIISDRLNGKVKPSSLVPVKHRVILLNQ